MRSAPAQSWRVSGWDEVSVRTAVAVLRAIPIAAMLIASTSYASPGERDKLNACQARIDRAAHAQQTGKLDSAADDAELQKCRQIIREWTLRDSRMSVDEEGRPLQ
jgi:hypothetical protein